MIERINPFKISSFGHYSQAVKIDLGTKTMILAMVEISNTVAKGCDVEIEVMAIIDNAQGNQNG